MCGSVVCLPAICSLFSHASVSAQLPRLSDELSSLACPVAPQPPRAAELMPKSQPGGHKGHRTQAPVFSNSVQSAFNPTKCGWRHALLAQPPSAAEPVLKLCPECVQLYKV
eukprot:366536-Chlamydomonas_euryale.AAC.14